MCFNFKKVKVNVEVAFGLPYFSECLVQCTLERGDDRSAVESVDHWCIVSSY